MTRCLVVANLTVVSDALYRLIQERVKAGPCQLHILVPAGRDVSTWKAHVEAEAEEAAHERLGVAKERFSALGVDVTGEIGDANPVQAIGDVLRRDPAFDEIILSTLPPGPSRWLGMDLPRRVERSSNLPVTHVVAH